MLKVQLGEPVLKPEAKVVQEETFMAKVDEVVAALHVSHGHYIETQYSQFNTAQILTASLGKQASLP